MIFTFVFLLVVGVVLFPTIMASSSSKLAEVPETIELNSVRDALMEKRGWSLERAEATRSEYVRFLTLLQMKPGFMLVPWLNADGQDDLDQFWHQHILDTAKYAADCDELFGRMIHHHPHVVRGSGEETEAVEKTQRLYARTFRSGTDGGSVDPIFFDRLRRVRDGGCYQLRRWRSWRRRPWLRGTWVWPWLRQWVRRPLRFLRFTVRCLGCSGFESQRGTAGQAQGTAKATADSSASPGMTNKDGFGRNDRQDGFGRNDKQSAILLWG